VTEDAAGRGEWLARCLGAGKLAPVERDDVDALAGAFDERFYAGGTCIFREGEQLTEVQLVKKGAVELGRRVGDRRVVFQLLGAGDVFGDVPVFMRTPTAFDACTVADSVIWSIPVVALFRLLGRRPGLAHRWLVSLAGRMAGLQTRIGELLAGSLEGRIAAFLLEAPDPADVAISQARLGDLLGARRTSVNQALKRLEARGILELSYRRIRVLDPAALAAVASSSDTSSPL
jgi:CRP-like cAMP-binding protein